MSAKTFKMNAHLLTGTALALVLTGFSGQVSAQETTVVDPVQTPFAVEAAPGSETTVDVTVTTTATPDPDVLIVDTAPAAEADVVIVEPVSDPAIVVVDPAVVPDVTVDPVDALVAVEPVNVVEPAEPANTMDASLDLITRGDVIKRQAKISEDLLIMGREIALIDTISGIVETIGIEGLREIYPELAARVEGTPIALKAEIGRATLESQLDTIALERAKMQADTAALAAAETPVEPVVETEDAGGFMGMTVAPVGADLNAQQEMQMQIDAQRDAELQALMGRSTDTVIIDGTAETTEVTTVSESVVTAAEVKLVEVYGAAGDLRARIDVRGNVTTVRVGDAVADLGIGAIGPDFIEVATDEDEPVVTRIRLNR